MISSQTGALCGMVGKLRPRLVRQLGRDDAEDALQDVYLAAARAIEAGAAIRNLEAYLCGIARVKAIDEIRRRQAGRRALLSLSPSIRDTRPDPEQALIERERRDQARRAIERLPAAGREVLMRFYVAGEPKESIQAEMDISPTRFRLLKSRSLERASRYFRRSSSLAA
jgi:RNA polymerase sigma factor (sigma-70 family)